MQNNAYVTDCQVFTCPTIIHTHTYTDIFIFSVLLLFYRVTL